MEGEESRQFVWQLLQEDIIETTGASGTGCLEPGDAEEELARRIALMVGQPQERVRRQVRKLVDRGVLRLGDEGWRWYEGYGVA